jgi:hypothetical protein
MYYLIRWVIRKLRRRTTSAAGTPAAVPAGTMAQWLESAGGRQNCVA